MTTVRSSQGQMAYVAALLTVSVVLWVPARAAGQEPLTIDRVVSDAIAGNPSLRAAHAAGAEAADHAAAAESAWFPRLSVSESWQHGNQPVFVFSSLLAARQFAPANFAIDALNHPNAISFFQTSVGLEQLLFDGGRQRAAVRSARLRRQMADLETDTAAATLALTVTEAYGRVLSADAGGRALNAALEA